ncbi:MAG: Trp family transcriptional regulator [Kiritimatiellae bacterium]|nr:Trp family transcriptional regulator [Kiritimatiellia bacterium]
MRKKHKIDMLAFERVIGVFASITTQEDMRKFMNELLTAGEMRDLTLRWLLLERLVKGETQRKIAEDLQISLCKITRGSKILKQKDSVTARVLKSERL